MRAGVIACPSAFRAETSRARPPQAQGDAMLVPGGCGKEGATQKDDGAGHCVRFPRLLKVRRVGTGQPGAAQRQRGRDHTRGAPFMSCRFCCVHVGTGAMAPPGAEKLTPRSPSGAGPRLDQVYCCPASISPLRRMAGAGHAASAGCSTGQRCASARQPHGAGHTHPAHAPTAAAARPANAPQAVARGGQGGADVSADAEHCAGGAARGSHSGQCWAGIACVAVAGGRERA